MRLNIINKFFKSKNSRIKSDLIVFDLITLQNTIHNTFNTQPIFTDLEFIAGINSKVDDLIENSTSFTPYELKEKSVLLHSEAISLCDKENEQHNKFKNLKINATMLLLEINTYLNQSMYFPRPILDKAQNLKNELSVLETLKGFVPPDKINEFETLFKETKEFLEISKTCYLYLKQITANKSAFNVTPQELNNLIFDYQKGEFKKIKAKFH